MEIERPGPRNAYATQAEHEAALNRFQRQLSEATDWSPQQLHENGPIRAELRLAQRGHVLRQLAELDDPESDYPPA